jgi:Uma2 family endonuclease
MSVPLPSPAPDERDLYPLHEEDDVPEIPLHRRVVIYLEDAVSAYLSDVFVTGNVCIYWEPGNFQRYTAPDLFVVREPLPEPDPRVYLIWRDPPIVFVAEIGSRSTRRIDEGANLPIFSDVLGIPEHLFADVETKEMRLRRLGPEAYEVVAPLPNGRVRSEQLGLEFEMDEGGFVWAYMPDGTRLLTYREETEQRQAAEERASGEARRRRQAETRARAEARQRQAAEARAAELERELAALRARLQDREA